jgi:large subunit ribosomal protein L18
MSDGSPGRAQEGQNSMAHKINFRDKRKARHARIRKKIKGVSERPRLSVFRSSRQIYAQLVDDTVGHTIAAASSLSFPEDSSQSRPNKSAAARLVGSEIAKRAIAIGVIQVVFDRGGYKYHGRIRALADAAREGGLEV